MLNRDVEVILYDDKDKFIGIKSQNEYYYGKICITGYSYIKIKLNLFVNSFVLFILWIIKFQKLMMFSLSN